MIIMAIDHTRDFFSSAAVDPSDPVPSWPALFATRWITHICAPGFVALAGVSIYLQRHRGKSVSELRVFLVTRGLWLAVFDMIGFGWVISFCFPPSLTLGPLWVSGLSMIVLCLLLPLRSRFVGVIGLAILAFHNLLDPIQASRFGSAAIVWNLLHQQTMIRTHGVLLAMIYPLIPWIGIIAVGYALGPLLALSPQRRQRASALLGLVSLAAFCALRALRGYGDPHRYVPVPSTAHSIMSFLDLTKYPPSLEYALSTGGVLLLLFSVLDLLVTREALPRLRAWLMSMGAFPSSSFPFIFSCFMSRLPCWPWRNIWTGDSGSSLSLS